MSSTTSAPAEAAVRGKPQLNFAQILAMSFGFFGIQIGFALQTGHFSRVFTTLGADIGTLPILWIAAPLTGLIVQPIIGYMSDRTWNRMGRRRPYFFWGAVLTTMGLFIMPNSSALWMAAGMLWIIDASLNITMEPFRAFVGDMLPDRQRTAGFAAQTFFIGLGGTVGSVLPYVLANYLGFSSEPVDGGLPDNIRMMFYVGGAALLISVMITVFTSKEYPPEVLKAYEDAEAAESGTTAATLRPIPDAPSVDLWTRLGLGFTLVGALFSAAIFSQGWDAQLYILGGGFVVFGLMQIGAAQVKKGAGDRPAGAYREIMEDMFRLPKTMRQLAIVQFFSWFAMFSMWIYLNDGVINFHYGAPSSDTLEYQEAGNWISLLNGVYFAVAALFAFCLPPLAGAATRKGAHAVCLLIGAVGFSSFIWLPSPDLLWVSMIGVGIVWASILSMPYAILSNALPTNKMGIYMGIFNFFIVIPQLVAASILGIIVTGLFDGAAIYALGVGAASFVCAAIAAMLVEDVDERVKKAA